MDEAYAKLLDQAGAADAWRQKFRPVLGPLAVAGPGPILPLRLLARASKDLGGPKDVRGVRSVLSDLRGLVVRRDAGAAGEHVGLFHPTLAEYLLGPSASRTGYTLDVEAAHRAVVQAIEALAPMEKHDRDDPLHRYAFLREADHLWAIGDIDRVFACLRNREANIPRENLERWRPWLSRFRERFDENYPDVLFLRSWIADWTGEVGDAHGAMRLFTELLPDLERVLGRDRPDTLPTRHNIAHWTGETGNARGALQLFSELLPDQERVLGATTPARSRPAATSRPGSARWATRAGAAAVHGAAAGPGAGAGARPPRHAQDPQQHRELDRPCGRRARGMRLFTELLPDRERVLGRDHPDTLTTRHNIAGWTGEVGDARGAAAVHGAAAGPGAGAGPRPPRHAHHPRSRRNLCHPVR